MVMPLSSFARLALVALPLALGGGCNANTKCAPNCLEPVPGGGADGSLGGQGGYSGTAGAGGGAAGGGGAMVSCPPPASTVCVQPAPSFAATITPILDRSCNTCHSDGNPDGVWPLQAWADVAAWSDLIIPDLVNCTMPPPDSGTSFPESDRQLFFAWLACGSPNN